LIWLPDQLKLLNKEFFGLKNWNWFQNFDYLEKKPFVCFLKLTTVWCIERDEKSDLKQSSKKNFFFLLKKLIFSMKTIYYENVDQKINLWDVLQHSRPKESERVVMRRPVVNFINVIHARFLYEFFDKAKTKLEKAAETTFVRKTLMKLTPVMIPFAYLYETFDF